MIADGMKTVQLSRVNESKEGAKKFNEKFHTHIILCKEKQLVIPVLYLPGC